MIYICANLSATKTCRSARANLRVALAIAPMRTGGMAMMRQPKAATYDRICALPAVLLDSTLWKYTCNKTQNMWHADVLRSHKY
jgi:hypothetical protein